MSYHLIPVERLLSKAQEVTSIGEDVHCLWECKLVQLLQKTVWRFLKKLKIELPYDLAVPLLSIYPKEMKTVAQKDIHTLMFTVEFKITKIGVQPKCPLMHEWIKKMNR